MVPTSSQLPLARKPCNSVLSAPSRSCFRSWSHRSRFDVSSNPSRLPVTGGLLRPAGRGISIKGSTILLLCSQLQVGLFESLRRLPAPGQYSRVISLFLPKVTIDPSLQAVLQLHQTGNGAWRQPSAFVDDIPKTFVTPSHGSTSRTFVGNIKI